MNKKSLWGIFYISPYKNLITKFAICIFMLCININAYSQQKVQVTGKITDESTGEPLIANVLEKGTNNGLTTTADGTFSLSVNPNAVLEISCIGFTTKEIAIGNQTQFSVSLTEEDLVLDDVVVVGYGTMRKKDLTGAITQIKPEKLLNENPATVQDLLRSGAPGLNVSISNSAKGGGDLNIRGQRSLNAGNTPLLVVDNMIFMGELSEINPQDIEQIDVLKDASSAAIFGAKSANGVIIITTKKGKTEKPVVRFDANWGIVTMGANREIYDADGYLKFRGDVLDSKSKFTSNGTYAQPTPQNLAKYGITLSEWRGSSTGTDDEIWLDRLGLFDKEKENYYAGKTFDWYDYTFQTGLRQDYNVSLSGSSKVVNYYLSLGYLDSKGLLKGDEYNTIRSNLKLNTVVNKYLEIGANVNFQNRSDGTLTGSTASYLTENSPFALPWDDDGKLVLKPMGTNSLNEGYNYEFDRQYIDMERGYTILNSTLTAKVKLPFNVTYTLNFAPRFQWYYNRYHESSQHPLWKNSHNGAVNRGQTKWYSWLFNNTINWEYTFAKKHNVNVTLSQEAEEHSKWGDVIEARDFTPTDALGFHYISAADKLKSSFSVDDTRRTGDALLARLFYSYDNRYMTTLSVRRDGYSAFGMANPRATFASVALAWTFTNESFFKWDAMSNGKLRFSWGMNGNRDIGMYTALSDLTGGSGSYAYLNSSGALVEMNQLYVSRMANHKLKWEKTSSWNAGLDFGFLNNRINGSVEYYYMPTTDLIMDQTLVNITGFSKVTSNLGEVVNQGIEISLNTTNIKTENFTWSTSLGLSSNRNRIKHLYYTYEDVFDDGGNLIGQKEKDVSANNWFIDQPISVIWNYKLLGIWQEDEKAEAALYSQVPGDPKAKDNYDVDSRKYSNEDKEFLGQTSPKIRWSLRNDFNIFKDFTASVNIYSYLGHKNASTDYLNTGYMYERANTYVREYWTPENPTNKFARLSSSVAATNVPRIIDRSFIRLESISLAYNVPKKYLSKLDISACRISASVRNVATWTKEWYIWDVETGSIIPRTFSVGVSLTF